MHALLKLITAGVLFVAACGGSAPGRESSSSGSQSAAASAGKGDFAGAATKVNIDEIFPAGPGRDIVLNNCQNCHTFVPIVVLQMDKDAWNRNSIDHRERVTNLTEDEFKVVYEYLPTNFGPHRPVPELPKELLESWTSY